MRYIFTHTIHTKMFQSNIVVVKYKKIDQDEFLDILSKENIIQAFANKLKIEKLSRILHIEFPYEKKEFLLESEDIVLLPEIDGENIQFWKVEIF